MFQFFIEKKIIPTKQSGFKPGDFCISQFLIIIHDNDKSFDEGHEEREVFLDTSKESDKVRNIFINFKLKQNGMS